MSILHKILATKAEEVEAARRAVGEDELAAQVADAPGTRSLYEALRRPPGQPIRAIAEVKRASPSAGPIRPDADPADIAVRYDQAGAAAISVLTDEEYFDGHLSFLTAARSVVGRPCLRKDFLIDPYQVVEARAAGADAVLLIVAALEDAVLADLFGRAADLDMDALVEVHDEAELERARAIGARIIGVNHRNLADFTIDMSLTERLRGKVPDDVVLVGESGIKGPGDVALLARAGADAILVGETLMRAEDPGAALVELLEGAS